MESVIPEDLHEHRLATWNNDDNQSSTVLPLEMRFNEGHVLSIAVYSVLLVVSAVGNCTVLTLLLRRGTPKTRINTMLVHLAVADLLVSYSKICFEVKGFSITLISYYYFSSLYYVLCLMEVIL